MANVQNSKKGLKQLRNGSNKRLLDPCPRCKCRRYSKCGCGGYTEAKNEQQEVKAPEVVGS